MTLSNGQSPEQDTRSVAHTDDPLSRPGAHIDYGRFLDCVHCGLCTSACPTFLETGNENDSPRGRIYLMRAVVDGRLQLTDTVRKHLDLCLDCRSCETACPSGVHYGRLIEPFRIDIEKHLAASGRASSGNWLHRALMYGLFPFANRLRWALTPARLMQSFWLDRLLEKSLLVRLFPRELQRMQRLLPRLKRGHRRLPDLLPAMGPRRARVELFTGCVADALFNETNWATARVLQANGCDVIIPQNQVCCGAIHYHNGAGQPSLDFANRNTHAFHPDDVDAIIVNAAGCGAMLKDYEVIARELDPDNEPQQSTLAQFAHKVRDVSEFLVELGPKPPTGPIPIRATYHDACHLTHAQKLRQEPRTLLSLVPELDMVEMAESDICCGAAGSYNLTEPEMSDRLAARKRQHILATGVQAVITGNVGCSLQIQASLKQAGRTVWVAHPMDILDLSYRHLKPPVGNSS